VGEAGGGIAAVAGVAAALVGTVLAVGVGFDGGEVAVLLCLFLGAGFLWGVVFVLFDLFLGVVFEGFLFCGE
jgi:hypothetical protein